MKRLDQLTFTRFIAAILIVIFHYGSSYFPFTREPWSRLAAQGPTVVAYFFVLSGFILTLVYYPKDGGKIPWLPFIVRRLARFYPLYLAAVLAMVPFRFGDDAHTLRGLALDLALLQPWVPKYALAFHGPAWAMSVLFSFYVIFPWVLPWFARKSLRFSVVFMTAFWVGSQVVIHGLYEAVAQNLLDLSSEFLLYFPLLHLNSFLLGMLGSLYYLHQAAKKPEVSKNNSLWLGITFLVVVAYIFFKSDLRTLLAGKPVFTAGLNAPLYLALIYFLARDTGVAYRFLSRKWLVRLGEISFSVYLLQSPMVQVYQTYLLDRLEQKFPWTAEVHFYLYLLILIAAAFLVYNLYEQPARKLILKVYSRLEKKFYKA